MIKFSSAVIGCLNFLLVSQSDQSQWGGGYQGGYTQGYEAHGGYAPPQDPNLYYGGYPGYANYPQQPQQVQFKFFF